MFFKNKYGARHPPSQLATFLPWYQYFVCVCLLNAGMFAFSFPSFNPVKHATVMNYICHTSVWWFPFLAWTGLGEAAVLFALCSGLERFCGPQTENILLVRLPCFDSWLFSNWTEPNFAYLLLLTKCIVNFA